MSRETLKKQPQIRIFLIILAILLVVCLAWVISISLFGYTSTWKCAVDFEAYEAEFVLVRDYVMAYFGEKDGSLYVSNNKSHEYDLYDNSTGAYLECPENIRTALQAISQQAFSNKDAHFETIRCEGGQVAFELISNPYRLVYSPDREPTIQTHSDTDTVLRKKIKEDWYHVTVQSK